MRAYPYFIISNHYVAKAVLKHLQVVFKNRGSTIGIPPLNRQFLLYYSIIRECEREVR